MSAMGYTLLQKLQIVSATGELALAAAVGDDLKGRVSLIAYLVSVPLAFVRPYLAITVYVCVAILWFIPDRRIESRLKA